MEKRKIANWIGVDWGTSSLRVWAMNAQNGILARAQSNKGMAGLEPDQFEAALLELISGWLGTGGATPVLCCGMVGARQGWCEAPYASVPLKAQQVHACPVLSRDSRISVHILPGLMQQSPPDVMRGEETQIFGFLASKPEFSGSVCLPGTHTKWVKVNEGNIAGFSTFLSGELFALLAEKSVLRHNVAPEGWDDNAFMEGFEATRNTPESLTRSLFSLRAASLLADLGPEQARAQLSGLLLGSEFEGAKPYWQDRRVAIIGAAGLSAIYGAALKHLGVDAVLLDVEEMTLKGLIAARASLS